MFSAEIKDRISDYYRFARFHLNSNLMMGCTSSQPLPPGASNIINTDPEKLVDNSNPQAEVSSADKYPPAEAFEVSLDDVDNDNDDDRSDSLIKKHPPKRLQKLVEQAATAVPATTIEHLEEKLAKAEVRRQQYIQQRIENIITVTSKGAVGAGVGGGSTDGGGGENEGNKNKDDDNDQNDDQKDGEAAVTVSSSRTTTSSNSSSQDADVVLQPTASLNEASVSVDKEKVDDGDHQDHGTDNGTHP